MTGTTPIRAALLDFDGTIVHTDFGDLLVELNGRRAESEQLNREFQQGLRPGIGSLIERTNMIAGITLDQINDVANGGDWLLPGAHELFDYFRRHQIVSIIASGSVVPVLSHFQHLLGVDHVVGTQLEVVDGVVRGVSVDSPPVLGFKLIGCRAILEPLAIAPESVLAVGDSPADREMMEWAGLSVAVNPVGGVGEVADHVVGCDLNEVVRILEARESAA